MAIKCVLFDFSGTLFRIESTQRWLTAVLDEAGVDLAPADIARLAEQLELAGALPGGAPPQVVPPHLAGLWSIRDESEERGAPPRSAVPSTSWSTCRSIGVPMVFGSCSPCSDHAPASSFRQSMPASRDGISHPR